MKTITITVSVDGNEVHRNFDFEETRGNGSWDFHVESMLDTLEKSSEPLAVSQDKLYPRTDDGYKQVDDNVFLK